MKKGGIRLLIICLFKINNTNLVAEGYHSLKEDNYYRLMNKQRRYLVLLSLLLLCLTGCSDESGKLTRIDIQEEKLEDIIITDQDKLKALENILKNIHWEENTKFMMARKEAIKATFFYQFDENMPEKLEEYLIWIHDSDTTELIHLNTNGSYGRLEKKIQ